MHVYACLTIITFKICKQHNILERTCVAKYDAYVQLQIMWALINVPYRDVCQDPHRLLIISHNIKLNYKDLHRLPSVQQINLIFTQIKIFYKTRALLCSKCVYVLKYYCDSFICIINMHIGRRNQDDTRLEDIIMGPLIRDHTDSSLYI